MMQEGGRAKQEKPTQEGSRGQCGVAAPLEWDHLPLWA